MIPAIVISAYNRPGALARLLASIQKAEFPGEISIPLVISIDHAVAHPDVVDVARQFSWTHGPKKILIHSRHLGPVAHYYACGELSQVYGSTIYLEDDLVVSPAFYQFAIQALEYFSEDDRIAGISLYALWFNGYTQEAFMPIPENADHFFLQVPYTQGQVFTKKQWSQFYEWIESGNLSAPVTVPMHEAWSHFRKDEWFPQLASYVISTGRFFVYPRISLTTGFGDAGTHFPKATQFFQVPLQLKKADYRFVSLDDSTAVYDSFFEILPDRLCRIVPQLGNYHLAVDLYATRTRQNIPQEIVLTTRPSRNPILTFGNPMRPMEMNLMYSVPGKEIYLSHKSDLQWNWRAKFQISQRKAKELARGRSFGKFAWLLIAMLVIRQALPRL